MDQTPPVEGLHHIGIAVPSLKDALPRWTNDLGLTLESVDEVPTEQVRVAVLRAGTTRIELLEPTSPTSPIAVFLQKRGPGIHHLAFQVGDCQQKIRAMAAAGAPMLSDAPRPGAHGCKVAFVHPKHLGGVLAELVEDPHHD
ncbi:MAG: methylmalonyl-CoA epimerase [Planctomycetes bacterium]|nr:methylmalonyl-CoA epimerase [Planctomycetota bacterium]MBZ0153546.1 methylmalonyl-CoA epimerase [Planctomycetota bacterium]MCC7398366.1 methylmalonyl-CoA epimerase [Planctomycetota bacterium]